MALVNGLVWLGVRTERADDLVGFFRDVLGFEFDHEDDDLTALKLPDGSSVEVFREDSADHQHFTTGPVAGFGVDDLDSAMEFLQGRGVEFIGGVRSSGSYRWAHFRGPDGNVYEITQT